MRLDQYLVQTGLARSRARAQEAVEAGRVTVNGCVVRKCAYAVTPADEVASCAENETFVSRGGDKLERAVEAFGLRLAGVTAMDIGASTGGFTDCLLRHGAREVYAVDSGSGQLAPALRANPAVHNMERCNIRTLDETALPAMDFICCDVSFISLRLVLPKIAALLRAGGEAVCLVKPQFEAGREHVGKRGIVREPKVHERVLEDVFSAARLCGLAVRDAVFSPIRGGDGNIEYLMLLYKGDEAPSLHAPPVRALVQAAFAALRR